MKINHENIDKWLFDYTEGNLNGSQVRELQNFLKAHPEYQEDLAAFQNATLQDEPAGEYKMAAELHQLAQPSYAKYAMAASLALLLLGGGAALIYSSYNSDEASAETVAENPANEENTSVFPSTAFINQYNNEWNNLTPAPENNTVNNNETENNIAENNAAVNNNGSPVIVNNTPVNNNVVPQNSPYSPQNGNPLLVNNGLPVNVNGVNPENGQVVNSTTENTDFSKLNLSPGLAFSDLFKGEEVAQSAFDVLKARRDAMNDNQIIFTPEEYAQHKLKNHHPSRKKFFDPELGFYNNRDHTLLHPGNMNNMEYAGFAGSSVSPAFQMNYRNQWMGNNNSASTYRFSYDQYSRGIGAAWGVGGSYTDFGNGMYTATNAMVMFSPKIRPSKYKKHLTIEPGISATYTQKSLDPSKIQPGMEIEPRPGFVTSAFENQSPTRTELSYFDINMSTLVNTKHFYAVVGVDNITSPSDNLYTNGPEGMVHLPRKFKAAVGTDFKQDYQSAIMVSPQMSFMHQGNVTEVWAGSLLQYDIINIDKVISFNIGASVSSNKQFSSTIGMKAGIFKFGYQFDVTKSYLTGAYYGSHEATLRISLHGLQKKVPDYLQSGIPEKE